MLRIIIRYICDNRRNSIIMIALFVIIFYLTGMMLDEQKKNNIERAYVNEWEDRLVYYHDITQADEKEQSSHFGYYRSGFLQNDATSKVNACWEVNEHYADWFIKKVRGRSLDFHSGRKEVLLYGSDLEKENQIGGEISLSGVKYTIVGVIPFDQPLFSYQYWTDNTLSSEQNFDEITELLDACLIYPYNGNMYIINDGSGCAEENWNTYGIVSVKKVDDFPQKDAILIKDWKQILLKGIGWQSRFSVFSILLLLGLDLFVLASISAVQYQQCHASLGVYCLCGMGQIAYDFLCSLVWLVNILAAYSIDYMLVCMTSGEMSVHKAGFLGIMAGSSLLLILIWNFISYRKAVLEVLKTE